MFEAGGEKPEEGGWQPPAGGCFCEGATPASGGTAQVGDHAFPWQVVLAMPYDTPVPGYKNDTVNSLVVVCRLLIGEASLLADHGL